MKLTKEQILKEFKEKGLTPLEEIESITNKILTVDEFGYKYYNSLSQTRNNKPLKFSKNNPYTIENIKTYLNNNNIDLKLISDKYINNREKLEWKCNCGTLFERNLNNVIDSKQYVCKECGDKTARDKHRRNYSDVCSYIESRGWKLLDHEYKNDSTKLTMVNKDGYKIKTKFSTFERSATPNIFDIDNPYTIENINTYLKNNNIKTKLLSEEYVSALDYMEWKCDCGEVFYRRWNNFYSAKQEKCTKCSHTNLDKKYSIEKIKEMVASKGCELISTEYLGNKIPLKIKCSCGNLIISNMHDFMISSCKCEDCLREQRRIISARMLEGGKMPTTLTTPHKIINSMLNDLNFEYSIEKNYKYYSIDTFVEDFNIPIEIMGDYWHIHPLKYEMKNLNKEKLYKIKQDKAKHTYIKNNYNQEILYLWEDDIVNNIDLCRQLILLYIKNNGKLLDYQSYNYHLTNSNYIKLNKIVIDPYFKSTNS